MALVDLQSGNESVLTKAGMEITAIDIIKDPTNPVGVSQEIALKPNFEVSPAGATYTSVDITISLDTPGIFRFGVNPGLGSHLPSEFTWHDVQVLDLFTFTFQLCMISPSILTNVNFLLVIVTTDGARTSTISHSIDYPFNLV